MLGRARGVIERGGSEVPVLKMGVNKRIVWGLFATFHRAYILIQGGLCTAFRAGTHIQNGWTYTNMVYSLGR